MSGDWFDRIGNDPCLLPADVRAKNGSANVVALLSGLHASETSFLTEGANRINIVLVNNGTLEDLTSAVQHAHDVNISEQAAIPVAAPKTTVYVDKFMDNYRWTWRHSGGNLQSILFPWFSTPFSGANFL